MTEQNDETFASKAEDKPPVEVNEQPSLPPAQSKVKHIFLRILRGFLGIAIVFGLGFLTAIFLLYVPARQIIEEYKSTVEQANQQIEKSQD